MNPSPTLHPALQPYLDGFRFDGDVKAGMAALLAAQGYPHTAGHCSQVANAARRIARQYQLDPQAAATAGWLHDISAIIPNSQRVQAASALGLEVLPAEAALPMILHQKLSAVIAEQAFAVADPAVLSAIGCHTTLKAEPAALDMLVFVADKIAWDQPGEPPWLAEIQAALDDSLEAASFCYTSYLWRQRASLPVVHPWFVAAHTWLAGRLGRSIA